VSSRSRVLAFNLILMLAACAATLGVMEIGLRLFLPQKLYRFPPHFLRDDPDLVFTMTPGYRGTMRNPEYTTHVAINALGLRGPEPGPRRPGVVRLLGLGDSFVSALNVEETDTFLAVAERAMTAALGDGRIQVVNAGTPNYGTWHEIRMFRRLASVLEPDGVILCVYVGNDVENNLAPRDAVIRDGLLVKRRPAPGILPAAVRAWLQRHSMVYVLLWDGWNRIRPIFGKTASDPLRDSKDLVSRRPVPHLEEGYRVTAGLLAEFREEARRLRLPPLVVLIPAEYQVYGDRFADAVRRQGLDPADFDLDLPNRRWTEMAERLGLPVLDLLPVFRARAAGGPYLYMSIDGHLTPEGNRVAGEAIARALLPALAARGGGEGRS
jgi:hypothetical protein